MGEQFKLSKSQKSVLNAITALILTFVNGITGLIITRLIIKVYGSDFNGLNSTVTQFVNMLMIVEGGFTLATNVALFSPIAKKDSRKINAILSATAQTFRKIGIKFWVLGFSFSFLYLFFINSKLSTYLILGVFMLAVFSSGFSLYYASKFRIMIQAEQSEYILNLVQVITIIVTQVGIFCVIQLSGNPLTIRMITMLGSLLNSILVGYFCKKRFKNIRFDSIPDFTEIKGTRDVLIQKITGMFYSTMPILFISATSGTIFASVYMVYNNVFSLLKNGLNAFINAPQMGFGQLMNQKNQEYVKSIFLEYEFVVILILNILLSVTTILIKPFIQLYTKGIQDIDYTNSTIAYTLIVITFFEIIHLPSGNLINMSGNFRIAKKIQLIACILIIPCMVVFSLLFGFYGILYSVLITAIVLATLEIVFAHTRLFNSVLISFSKILMINVFIFFLVIFIGGKIIIKINSYTKFIIIGIILVLVIGAIVSFINFLFYPDYIKRLLKRFKLLS